MTNVPFLNSVTNELSKNDVKGLELANALMDITEGNKKLDDLLTLQSSASEIDGLIGSLNLSVSSESILEVIPYGTLLVGYYNKINGSFTTFNGWKSYKYSIEDNTLEYSASSSVSGSVTALACYYDSSDVFIGFQNVGTSGTTTVYDKYVLTLPLNTAKIALTSVSTNATPIALYKKVTKPVFSTDLDLIENSFNYWKDKSIVWFGTSIPAGAGTNAYPIMVCEDLGATLTNEAVGSSMARNGSATIVVSGTDPYGWTGLAWQNVAYSLSATIAEKQYLINNWATWKTKLTNTPPDTLTDTQKAFFLNCSYENKLYRHLGTNRKDLYVFDHGHNDNFTNITTVPANEYDRGYFIGAMNFLIKEILTDNPKAKICFIGHYENARKTDISTAQTTLAEIHDFPFLKLWSKLGWTQRTVLVSGVSKTLTSIWMIDDLHPHSDTTYAANQKVASYIIPFIRNEVR